MRRPLAATLLAVLLVSHGLIAAEKPPEKIAGKVRTEIAFGLAAEFPNAEGRQYGLTRVQRNGNEVPAPANMKLDPKTGAFSWTPTGSQAGDYEVAFLIKNPAGENAHASRLIAIEAPPIVPPNDNSEIAKLLRQWHKEGTAAGNTGDFYDNRDRGHSGLDTSRYPQLDKVEYTKEQLDRRMDWALQAHLLFPHVTFGNSSTASGDMAWGSNPRHALLSPQAVQMLYQQYTRNHLYIYPEHRDHDPGHNGRGGGYGDMFPANIPYVIVSQGSSGSDQPFMQAVPYTLAAFRPEVKELLVGRGILMPTVQMIFRSSSKLVEKPEDYLTGKAHPSVFEGGTVAALKMAQMAHEMKRDSVPPMVQLAVFEEDLALAGRDYFDAPRGEGFFDTPCAIARIIRSTKLAHRMVVSAKGSYDANSRPLKFHWAVLRGDAGRIQIKPLEADASRVELIVPFHERRPVLPGPGPSGREGSKMESNRVDIAAFVHNGACYSAPAFISLFYLDDEARTYGPDGRVLEVGYGLGDSAIGCHVDRLAARDKGYDVTDWPAFLALLAPGQKGFPADLLRKRFTPEELAALQPVAKELDAACEKEKEPKGKFDEADAAAKKAREATDQARKAVEAAKKAQSEKPGDESKKALDDAEAKLKALQDEQKKADQAAQDARRKLEEAQNAASGVLTANRPPLGGSVKERLERALNDIRGDPDLFFANAQAVRDLAKEVQQKNAIVGACDDLVKQGIVKAEAEGRFVLTPVVPGPKPPAERLARFERNRLEWFNIGLLQGIIYPGLLNRSFQRNYVNPLLATPKSWRDVYRYDGQGRLIGWTRYEDKERKEFAADGALVLKKDALGRPIEARTVAYVVDAQGGRPRGLKQQPGDTLRYYQYDSDKDLLGRIEKTEKAPQ